MHFHFACGVILEFWSQYEWMSGMIIYFEEKQKSSPHPADIVDILGTHSRGTVLHHFRTNPTLGRQARRGRQGDRRSGRGTEDGECTDKDWGCAYSARGHFSVR